MRNKELWILFPTTESPSYQLELTLVSEPIQTRTSLSRVPLARFHESETRKVAMAAELEFMALTEIVNKLQ